MSRLACGRQIPLDLPSYKAARAFFSPSAGASPYLPGGKPRRPSRSSARSGFCFHRARARVLSSVFRREGRTNQKDSCNFSRGGRRYVSGEIFVAVVDFGRPKLSDNINESPFASLHQFHASGSGISRSSSSALLWGSKNFRRLAFTSSVT